MLARFTAFTDAQTLAQRQLLQSSDDQGEGFDVHAGVWVRMLGTTGFYGALVGSCPEDAAAALDGWFRGGLIGE